MSDIDHPYQFSQGNYENNNFFSECISVINTILLIITVSLGCILYFLAIIDFYNSIKENIIKYNNSIYASLLILFCPLWLKSSDIECDLKKDFSRIYIIIFLLIGLLGLIFSDKSEDKSAFYISNSLLLISDIFLILSYLKIGNEKCQNNNVNCDPFCCFPRYTIIDCNCNCDCGDCGGCCDCGGCGDCGDCGGCGDCGDCGDCVIMWQVYILNKYMIEIDMIHYLLFII